MKRGPKTGAIDVYPQQLSWNLTQSAADALATVQVFTPISRLPKHGNKITVMELLDLEVVLTNTNSTIMTYLDQTADNFQWAMMVGTTPTSFPFFGQGNVLAYYGETGLLTTSGTFKFLYPQKYSFAKNDGRGILLAVDSFQFVLDTNGSGVVNRADCKLQYRFVDVTLEEYVGIVQSQQSA